MAQDPHLIQIRELKDTIAQLNETISLLNNNLQESLKREAVMQEQIDYLTKKLFGRSSEKKVSQTEGQLSLFDEAENEADPDAEEPDDIIEIQKHIRKAKKTNKDKYAGLPVRDVVLELPEADRVCPQRGGRLEEIGRELARE